MFTIEYKCSLWNVFSIFVDEQKNEHILPTTIKK